MDSHSSNISREGKILPPRGIESHKPEIPYRIQMHSVYRPMPPPQAPDGPSLHIHKLPATVALPPASRTIPMKSRSNTRFSRPRPRIFMLSVSLSLLLSLYSPRTYAISFAVLFSLLSSNFFSWQSFNVSFIFFIFYSTAKVRQF